MEKESKTKENLAKLEKEQRKLLKNYKKLKKKQQKKTTAKKSNWIDERNKLQPFNNRATPNPKIPTLNVIKKPNSPRVFSKKTMERLLISRIQLEQQKNNEIEKREKKVKPIDKNLYDIYNGYKRRIEIYNDTIFDFDKLITNSILPKSIVSY